MVQDRDVGANDACHGDGTKGVYGTRLDANKRLEPKQVLDVIAFSKGNFVNDLRMAVMLGGAALYIDEATSLLFSLDQGSRVNARTGMNIET